MLRFPGNLDVDGFLDRHWQKERLAMPAALQAATPALSRNDLAWLAMQEDVESRIVFIDRGPKGTRYRVEDGPFDESFLQTLPKTDWTLLVHDVEKHLPDMRRWFEHVPFIPDWRIDDLMISFAAPGGGVGPHRDNYDVFLCQGIGVRRWDVSTERIAADHDSSTDLLLLEEFSNSAQADYAAGDVLYLPPGVAHWGVARRACITYSIGMRAPQLNELRGAIGLSLGDAAALYRDPDLAVAEAKPGYLSQAATRRLQAQLETSRTAEISVALGKSVTQAKDWLLPERPGTASIKQAMRGTIALRVHGMARIAYDETHCFANGECLALPAGASRLLEQVCTHRRVSAPRLAEWLRTPQIAALLQQMLAVGTFDLSDMC